MTLTDLVVLAHLEVDEGAAYIDEGAAFGSEISLAHAARPESPSPLTYVRTA
jgi:hypothetical protein